MDGRTAEEVIREALAVGWCGCSDPECVADLTDPGVQEAINPLAVTVLAALADAGLVVCDQNEANLDGKKVTLQARAWDRSEEVPLYIVVDEP